MATLSSPQYAAICRECGVLIFPCTNNYQGLCPDCARAEAERQYVETVINTARLIVRSHNRWLNACEEVLW